MQPGDDFRRVGDPTARRRAVAAAALVVAALGVLLAATTLGRGQQPSPPAPTRASRAVTTAAPTAPTPVPAIAVLGSGFAAAYDDRSHQLVAFGGVDSGDQTWVWDGRRWRLLRLSAGPPARSGAALAYDPRDGVLLLFGGMLPSGELADDTWSWDGHRWRRLAAVAASAPPAGEGGALAWDQTTGQMLLVTAHTGTENNAQTWIWDGASWMHSPSGDLPAATYLIGMAVDPVTRLLIGVSCCSPGQGDVATLAWNGSSWHVVATPTMPGFAVGMVPDPVSSRVLLFADPSLAAEVWAWTGHDWTLVPGDSVPVFPAASLVDADLHRVVIVGSVVEPVQGTSQPVQVWVLDGGTAWRRLG